MKRLVLEIVRERSSGGIPCYVVRIKDQTHRGGNFGVKGKDNFIGSNGIKLYSVGCPQWKPYDRLLYLRGYEETKDYTELTIPVKEYEKIMVAVKEYNDLYGPKMSDFIDDNLFEVQ